MDLTNLNQQQLQAITAPLGPIAVIAGAGSGKTRVLTMRYAYLIDEFKFEPQRILAITFTNKAAAEMKSRLRSMVNDTKNNWIGTFHSICLRILRHDIHHLKRQNDFNIIDDEDQVTIFKEAYKNFNIDTKDIPYVQIFHLLDKYKRNQYTIADLGHEDNWGYLNIKDLRNCVSKTRVVQFYEKFCLDNNLLDFNDLLVLTNKLLQIDSVKQKWQAQFDYILVDEFQDTNDEQYAFIKALSNHQNLFVVGDPDQMIYSWRGAHPNIIKNLHRDFEKLQTIILDVNYRSTQTILDAANHLISFNKNRIKKDLIAHYGTGPKPIYFHADSQDGESRWVTNKILELLEKKVEPQNIAILYRANSQSRNIEQTLITNGIKYRIYGGIKFYQRKEIKDLIAYLKTLYCADELSIKRVINIPKRGIGLTSLETITQYAKAHNINFQQALRDVDNIDGLGASTKKSIHSFFNLLESIDTQQPLLKVFNEVIEKTQYIEYLKNIEEFDKINNIDELRSSIYQYEIDNPKNTFMDYLQEISLYTDTNEQTHNAISLMTIHISKGLEFEYVFIIGLVEETFPTKFSLASTESMEEERRIAYVAITRAKKQLYLSSYGGISFIYNSINLKSRFIEEISTQYFDSDILKITKLHSTHDDDWFNSQQKIDLKSQYTTEEIKFKIGDQIVHTSYGQGYVLAINNGELTVLFKAPYNKKIILANHKSIQRLLN